MISLSKGDNTTSGLFNVSIDDIIYIEYEKSSEGVFFHTKSERYYSMGSLKYWLENLKNTGFKFEKVDRNIAIHLSKISHLDDSLHSAYFDSKVNKNSKVCPIAVSNFKFVKAIFETAF